MSPERAKETNAHRHALVWFRPFRAGKTDYRIPRAALRLPWADMFLTLRADLCSTTRVARRKASLTAGLLSGQLSALGKEF